MFFMWCVCPLGLSQNSFSEKKKIDLTGLENHPVNLLSSSNSDKNLKAPLDVTIYHCWICVWNRKKKSMQYCWNKLVLQNRNTVLNIRKWMLLSSLGIAVWNHKCINLLMKHFSATLLAILSPSFSYIICSPNHRSMISPHYETN